MFGNHIRVSSAKEHLTKCEVMWVFGNHIHVSSAKEHLTTCEVMWVFGNHIRVSSVKEHLTTCDTGVVVTFEQICVSIPNDQKLVLAKLEYVGWVEEISKLNHRVLNIVVLLCNWVKAKYVGSNATMK